MFVPNYSNQLHEQFTGYTAIEIGDDTKKRL